MKPSYFVLNGHTLGFVYIDRQPNVFSPIGAMIHKETRNPKNGIVMLTRADNLEVATLEDFKRFRVDPKGHITE